MNAPLAHPITGRALPDEIEPDPIEIDPRPCDACGLTIDQHERVDTPEGPEFFCDDFEREIMLGAADIVRRWELADPRDRWKHTGEQPARAVGNPATVQPYRTPQATIDAFWYVVRLDNPDYLARWLCDHKSDAAHLLKIWKSKQC
jgi:hypothetical protein